MNISVEISMYPLHSKFEEPILAFIEKLHNYENIEIITNTMSTQIFGEYHTVLGALSPEIEKVFRDAPTTIMVMKMVNQNLQP